MYRESLTHRPISTLVHIFTILIMMVVCGLGVILARLRVPTFDLAVSSQRLVALPFTDGFYGVEYDPAGAAYRWTTGSLVVQLRGAAQIAPAYRVVVRLRSENPAGPQPLTFLADGQPLATVLPETRFRSYQLFVRPAADGELRLNMQTATFRAARNPRDLGFIASDLILYPLPQVDWFGVAVVCIGLLLLWAVLYRTGVPFYPLTATITLATIGLLIGASYHRPSPLPFAALAATFLVATTIVAWLTQPQSETTHTFTRIGLITLILIVSFSSVIWPGWLSDDAFISFRYAQNLVAGNGLVYNLGERVEGYTNFLWTLLAAGILFFGGDLEIWSYASGSALALAILLLSYAVTSRLRSPTWGLVAAVVVGTSQSLLLYTARGAGLETGLFTLLSFVGSSCYLFAATRPAHLRSAGFILALAAMTRPEGVLVFAITAVHLALVSRRVSAVAWFVGAFLALFVPYYLWRWGYYGDLLPNTFYAKTGGGIRQLVRGLNYAAGFALSVGGPLLLAIAAPWQRDWRAALTSWRSYMLALTLVYSAYIIAVGGDHFRGERFFVPVLPWLAILLADGLATLIPVQPRRPLALSLTILLILSGSIALNRTAPLDETISGLDESVWIWREIGWWIADHTPPEASLAAQGAGAVAYYSQHPVIDLFGLTEKHIARISIATMGAGVAGHEKHDPTYILQERQPTYIPQIWEDYFGGAAQLTTDYRLITITTRSGREMRMWERLPS